MSIKNVDPLLFYPFLLIFALLLFFVILHNINFSNKDNALQDMVQSNVVINSSSGVIVHKDPGGKVYILTAHHTISDDDDIIVYIERYDGKRIHLYFNAGNVAVIHHDIADDLALVTAYLPGDAFRFAKVSTSEPELGEEVLSVGNPSYNNNTVSFGTLSNKNRVLDDQNRWQVSTVTIFGASGSAVFNDRGEVVGIVSSMGTYMLPECDNMYKINRDEKHVCDTAFPVPQIGYVVPLNTIKEFLLSSPAATKFKYLR